MQQQVTIFGEEKAVKARNHSLSIPECAAVSELLNRPVFLAGKGGKGTWISSAGPGCWGQGKGTRMGLTGQMKGVNMGAFGDHVVTTWAPSVIGSCLMDNRAIEVLPSPPNAVIIRNFGVLGTGKTYSIDRRDLK